MTGLVEEIQRAALDPNVRVSTLLRQVKLAAVKLNLDSVERWVESELGGYQDSSELPEYRKLSGVAVALAPSVDLNQLSSAKGWNGCALHMSAMQSRP